MEQVMASLAAEGAAGTEGAASAAELASLGQGAAPSLLSQAKDAYDIYKKGTGLYNMLNPQQSGGTGAGGSGANLLAMLGQGGNRFNAADAWKQRMNAQSLRERAEGPAMSPGPGWIPGG